MAKFSKATAARLQTAFAPSTTRPPSPFRLAFFGGSFDPPHLGHLQIAAAAADHFSLDQVWFEPAGRQPLKDPAALAPYPDRLAMTCLACAPGPDNPSGQRFVAQEHDAPRADGLPNYTVDALIALNNSLSSADTLFCLVGVDAFRSLDRWHRPVRLLGQAHWVLVGRPGFALSLDELRRILPPCEISPLRHLNLAAFDCIGEKFSTRLYLFDAVHADISSTQIRDGLRTGGAARAHAESQLPPAVADYIRSRNLYA